MPDQDILLSGERLRAIDFGDGTKGLAVAVKDVSQFFVETTVALGGNQTFTGPWRDCIAQNWFGAVSFSDVAHTLAVDEADASPANVADQVTSAAAANTAGLSQIPSGGYVARVAPTKIVLRWNRVRLVNGAGAQARLNVQSTVSPLN